MVEDGAFSHKIVSFTIVLIPNHEGHLNCITGSKGMAISLNGWILPIGGVALVLGLRLRLALHKSNMALHNKCVLLIKDFHVLVVKDIFIFDLSRKTIYQHFLEPFTRYVDILTHVNFLF